MNLKKKHIKTILLAASFIFVGFGGTALAQTFIEPSGPAPGGRSATYLDTSSTTQKKLGSLIIGDGAGTAETFCLNANSSASTDANCITTWTDLLGKVGGPFVETHADDTITSPGLPSSYDPSFQIGYARVRGNASPATDAIVATANLTYPGTAVAVYGTDNRDNSNYAGYFSGRLSIVNHYELSPIPDIPGEICLNADTPYNPADAAPRYGCIDDWADVGGVAAGPYVQLQPANPPNPQVGSAWISKSWQMGAVVAGNPSFVSTSYCGDGLCSTNINESSGSCAIDCNGFSGFGNITTDPCQDTGTCDSGVLIPPVEQ